MANFPGVYQNDATQQADAIIKDILIPLEGRANTDARLAAIMDSFVKLGDTKKAKLEKIRMAKEFAKISKLEKDAEEKIIDEKGYSPFNLADLAWKASAPQREKLYTSLEKPLQQAQKSEWIEADEMPAAQYAGQEREAEDGTIEYSNGTQWIKGRNPNKVRP